MAKLNQFNLFVSILFNRKSLNLKYKPQAHKLTHTHSAMCLCSLIFVPQADFKLRLHCMSCDHKKVNKSTIVGYTRHN